jgi:LysM repeat protein/lysozyme family protein
MGSNPIPTNKGRSSSPSGQEVKQHEAEPLSMPSRGSVAHRIMSMTSSDRQAASQRSEPVTAQQTQLAALYRVRPGDNPSTIAKRFDVPLQQLFAANPELEPTKMRPGQGLRIPGVEHNFHIVEKGESFTSVAARHQITLNDLRDANPHIEPKKLQIGQALYLPVAPPAERTAPSRGESMAGGPTKAAVSSPSSVYAIKAGDTLGEIAAKYKVSLKDLVAANPGLEPRKLSIGKEIAIPGLGVSDAQTALLKPLASTPSLERHRVVSEPGRVATHVGHSAEWKHIPVDPKLLEARYVSPLSTETSSNFFVSVMRTLGHEGGLSSNSNDLAHQGGVKVTNYGITGMAMVEYLKTTLGFEKAPSAEVLTERIKSLSYAEALDIYASNYWQKEYRAIDKRVAFVLFDWGVIGGSQSTLMRVQDALGVPKTGKMDASTIKAMNAMDGGALSEKITELRVARHRERVAEISAKIKKWDDITEAGGKPNFNKPKDQSGHLKGWVDRAVAVNAYANSKEFNELAGVFERTAPQGADLMDPVRAGKIALKKHSEEPALIRMLQQRLSSVGYTVHEDGKFEREMEAVVNFFQEHYNLQRQPAWGADEMRILDALMVAKQRREHPSIAGISR